MQLLPVAWRVRLPFLALGAAITVALWLAPLDGQTLAVLVAGVAAGLLLADWFIEAQITSPLKRLMGAAEKWPAGRPRPTWVLIDVTRLE